MLQRFNKYLNFESAKFLVKIKKSVKEKIDD